MFFLLRFAKITEFRGIYLIYYMFILFLRPYLSNIGIEIFNIVGDIQVTNAFDATVLDLNPTVPEADVFKDK